MARQGEPAWDFVISAVFPFADEAARESQVLRKLGLGEAEAPADDAEFGAGHSE